MELIRYSIASIILIIFTILRQIHIIQLNSYNLDQQIIWYKKNISYLVFNIVLFISTILCYEFKLSFVKYLIILSLLGILIENLPRKQKKKLVFTKRIIRLIFICLFLFIISLIPSFYGYENQKIKYILYTVSLSHLIIFISYIISLPIENLFRKKFMLEAKKIIEGHKGLYVIGITGSFGKTSVKYYLNRILKEEFSVCMTRESFNTPMGATLTIKNELRNIDDIFICEMGARRINDINEIADIVMPYSCIITDVGNMHLDTFKNINNVLKTKFELVHSVSKHENNSELGDGIILLNGDNDLIRNEINNIDIKNKNIVFYGLNNNNDFYAENIETNNNGTNFLFKSKFNHNIEIETNLLGKYNVMNLVAAISFSILLNVPDVKIKKAVKSILPVEHRLSIISSDANCIIIDDAYNSNEKGAKNAVDVINSFNDYKKIIITPGMVELSDEQNEINERFAEYASKIVDYAIVVGKTNKLSLNSGFSKKLDKDSLINIDRVEDAIFYARNNISGKKVILIENDLSDNY